MKEIQKQQVWDRVESLRGTDVGKRAFKNLSAKVSAMHSCKEGWQRCNYMVFRN